jgi:hypothetical protein
MERSKLFNQDSECFVETHLGFAITVLEPGAEVTLVEDRTRNHNITDVEIEASSVTENAVFLVVFKTKCGKTITREVTLINFLRDIHFEIEDFRSLTIKNPSSTVRFQEIFVRVQKTFCICCNEKDRFTSYKED